MSMRYYRFGEILPQGWIKEEMTRNLRGFVGNLDRLVPELIIDDEIYGRDRLTKKVKDKDVGAVADGGEWEVQYLWWNSETQSNWRDGMVRHGLLLQDEAGLKKAKDFVDWILSTQDEDGYLGIYEEDLRYNFNGENGELWAQSSLFRVLLGYYEATGDEQVLEAVIRAMDVTMKAYPIEASEPFNCKDSFAGLAHGLTITDSLNRLYELTGNLQYLRYAVFLYEDYCTHDVSEPDIQMENLVDETYRFKGHGVHTYEHLRALTIAAFGSKYLADNGTDDEKKAYREKYSQFDQGLDAYLKRLPKVLTPSGGPIGDEWIFGKDADATRTGYEYCSIHELLDAYTLLMEKNGDLSIGDDIEWLLYNAAQGAKHRDESAICYLKTDNAYSLAGKRDHLRVSEDDETQTRFRYSPTHKEAAVCCVPNAGRVVPYFVKAMLMSTDEGIAVPLYGPSTFVGDIGGVEVCITQQTAYPYDFDVTLEIETDTGADFTVTLRDPKWSRDTEVICDGAEIYHTDGTIKVKKVWQTGDCIRIGFTPAVTAKKDLLGETFFTYGPLLMAMPIDSRVEETKDFGFGGFRELNVYPKDNSYAHIAVDEEAGNAIMKVKPDALGYDRFSLAVKGWQGSSEKTLEMVPIGKTILRRVTFPMKQITAEKGSAE